MLAVIIPAIMWAGHEIFGALEPTAASIIASKLGQLSTSGSPIGKIIGDVVGTFKEHGVVQSADQEQQYKLRLQSMLGQIDVDKIEAQSESRFDSGWRPFLAWGLSTALLMSVLVEPTINYLLGFFGVQAPPAFVLGPAVMSMLSGLCGLYMVARTGEKVKGVN